MISFFVIFFVCLELCDLVEKKLLDYDGVTFAVH